MLFLPFDFILATEFKEVLVDMYNKKNYKQKQKGDF